MYFAKFREVLMARVNILSRLGSLMTNNLIHLSSEAQVKRLAKPNVWASQQSKRLQALQTLGQVSSRPHLQAERRSDPYKLTLLTYPEICRGCGARPQRF